MFHLATDEVGNRNNILKLPKTYIPKIKDEGRRTSTPIGQVASVAAEVADIAAKLDEVRIGVASGFWHPFNTVTL